MSKMKLYYAPGTCALACWIALEWSKADYEVEKVDYRSESYKKINPLGLVPALEIWHTRPMTQANAILQYIIDKYEENDLGADKWEIEEFEFNEIMCFLTWDFHPAFWPMFAPQRFTTDSQDESIENVKKASYPRIERVLEHLNNIIGEDEHVYKNKKTVADAYAFVMARWSEYAEKSWKEYPNLARFMEKMQKDETVIKVLELSRK